MVKEMKLNDQTIELTSFEEEEKNGRLVISVKFNVTSEEYHDVTTLLYEEKFDIIVPEKDMKFKGVITNYLTSLDNLYEENQVGEYQVTFTEIE
ncbi:DUF3219 family protein [Salinicoccus halodurans]|uniref:DUF3219 domain-containing protein n=1 Tax=Salinicoccus halodurans TaxID=407035 RepID=A0A0F7HJ39_9STAP|nr:DUF3219 family protein [Salinicoccus halodurans]AKG73037.1 hypothetical protein AAT16_01640 [Salinicoccus halodurans]SFK77849.1 Protein of unknown function [Salinicoccus halodurans]